MPKSIKTRNTVKNIKVLDKSVNTSRRIKDALRRVKDTAEETGSASHAAPTDYASDNIQSTVRNAAIGSAHNLHTPRHKVSESIDRAKGHFAEVKRQMPGQRQQAATEAQNTAQSAKANAAKLRSEANHAFNRAEEAKTAVKDAKMALKEVRRSGRQTIREKLAEAAQNGNNLSGNTQNGIHQAKQGHPSAPVSQNSPVVVAERSAAETVTPLQDSGKLSHQWENVIKTRNNVKLDNTMSNHPKINAGRPVSGTTRHGVNPSAELSQKSFATKMKRHISKLTAKYKTTVSKIHNGKSTASAGMPNAAPDKSAVPVGNSAATSGKPSAPVGESAATLRNPSASASRPSASPGKPATPTAPQNAAVSRPSYTNVTPRGANKVTGTLQSPAKSIPSAKTGFKKTAKGTIKTTKKSVKTAEETAKKAVKTAKQTAKAAHKSAKAAAKAAKTAERAARAAAKVAAKTAKISVKTSIAMVKAAIAALKGLVALIVAGGWIAVLIIIVVCLVGLMVGSVFGIFFSSEANPETGQTIGSVAAELETEYSQSVSNITSFVYHDYLDTSGLSELASWKYVLAVYAVKTSTDAASAMEVAVMDDTKAALLRSVFWDMNELAYTTETIYEDIPLYDEDGLPTGDTTSVPKTVLVITMTPKSTADMVALYGLDAAQTAQLEELLESEYDEMWEALLASP